MSRAKLIKLIVVAAGAVAVVAALISLTSIRARLSGPGLASRTTTHDLGEVLQGSLVEHAFVLGNDAASDLVIEEVIPWASTVVSVDSVLAPGGEGRIRVRLDTRSVKGQLIELVKVRFAGGERNPVWLELRGRVVLPVQIAPKDRVYFFTVKGEGAEQQLELINHQEEPLEILGVTSPDPLFRAEAEAIEQGRRYNIMITLDPTAPVGRHETTIAVRTTSRDYPSLEIIAWARVRDVVSTSISQVSFGRIEHDALKLRAVSRRTVLVEKYRGTDFQVLRASSNVPLLDVEVVPHKSGESFLVHVTIVESRVEKGEFEGTLVIETNDPAFGRLELPITGAIL